MNVYIYRADLYCEPCGDAIIKSLTDQGKSPVDPFNEYSYDSDDYPKGPYPDGGGESEIAQVCADCGLSLNNPVITE